MTMDKFRFTSVPSENATGIIFDISIACLGYESRATAVTKQFFQLSARKVAIAFERQKVLAFATNRKWYSENNVEIFGEIEDEAFQPTVESLLSRRLELAQPPLKIAVDISCFDRYRLAVLCQVMQSHIRDHQAEVWFFYSIAEYAPPILEFSVNARLQPVHPSFVGTRPDPLAGTVAIIGLGYEREKALGAAEYLQANEVFTYCPSSSIKEYLPSVESANELLLNQMGMDNKFVYEVEQPAMLVSDLSSLVKGLLLKSAVILIPLGPKIFALACLLTAGLFPDVSVWRMSQGKSAPPTDRKPTAHFSVLKVSD